jgi:hypothetical protein
MATIPIKSLFGKILGLSRATTAYPIERLVVPGGIITQALYMSTSEGSEQLVQIAGFSNSETGTTSANLSVRGITIISSAAATGYVLPAPPAAGIRKVFMTSTTSTAVRSIASSGAGIVYGISQGGGSGLNSTGSTAGTNLSLTGMGNYVELTSISTLAWYVSGIHGFSTAVTPFSTA